MRHERGDTSEGYEYNFAVNTLGTHVLMSGLRPVLGRTAREETNRETRSGEEAEGTRAARRRRVERWDAHGTARGEGFGV